MRRKSSLTVAATLVATVVAVTGCSRSGPADPANEDLTAEVVIGGSGSNSWLPIRVALDKGYFADEGLTNVTFTEVASAPAASAALASGDVHFAALAVERGIQATIAGNPTKCVMSIQDTPPTSLVLSSDSDVRPGDWQGLSGLTIGVSLGGWSEIMPKYLLAKNGVDVDSVNFTSTPDATTMLTALREGAIDGFSGIEPAQRNAVHNGVGKIFFDLEDPANLAQWPSPFVATCLQASSNYIEGHPKTVAAMRRAIVRAYTEVEANPSIAIELAQRLQPNVDAAVLADSVEHLAVTWSKDGSISEEAIKNLQDLLTEFDVLPRALPYEQTVAP